MDDRHLLAAASRGILERVLRDALAALARSDRPRLCHGGTVAADLEGVIEADVQALGIFANNDDIDVLVPPARHDRLGGPDVRVEVELLAHGDVHRAVAAPHRSRQRAFQAESGAADRIERRVRKRRAGHLDGGHAAVLLVPIELYSQCVQYLERRFSDLGADPITTDECGFANRQGRPGVRLFTARVRAVQGSSPSPRAMVRHPILPMRESMSTTESSAVASAGVPPGVAGGVPPPYNTSARTHTYFPPTTPTKRPSP